MRLEILTFTENLNPTVSGLILKWKYVMSDNHKQNIVDKFTKLSKMGVSLECFTTDFSKLLKFGFWVAG